MTLIDDAVLDDLFAIMRIETPTPPDPAIDDLFTTHTYACVSCGAEYQTCNPKSGGRCSRCLVNKIDAPAASASARITCRVCGAPATVPLGHPALLCPLCLEDLDGTRDRHAARVQAALGALDANKAVWDSLRAESPAQAAWERVQGALIAVAEKRARKEDLDRTWAKRKAEGGAFALLLTAYETYTEEADRLADEMARLDAAQREINQAFLSEEL